MISGPHQWTFHLAGVTTTPPPFCLAHSCLYTRETREEGEEDTSAYCFSSNSCINNLTSLHRVSPPASQVTEDSLLSLEEKERLAEAESPEPEGDSLSRDSCYPVKTVSSSKYPRLAGIYILYGKFPHKKNKLCNDHCVYITVRTKETSTCYKDDITLCLQDSDKRMEKYCFGEETEAVLTSYHTSLPGVRKARLETSETPIPLTATTLQSVLQPISLNKTDDKINSESIVEIFRKSYPYKLNPKTGGEERMRTIPYKINDDSDVKENFKNAETKENSSNQFESTKKIRKIEGKMMAIPYKMKKAKEEEENKESEGEQEKEEVVAPEEPKCYRAGGLRVEREVAQQAPKELRRSEAPVEMCGNGGGGEPVRIRQREQPTKIYVGLEPHIHRGG